MSELQQAEATGDDRRRADNGAAGDVLLMHQELLELELYKIRRELLDDPRASKIAIGLGQSAEQTVAGNQQDPFNGCAIFNPTSATLAVGFNAGMGLMGGLIVPPFSWVTLPERHVNLSIALPNITDQQQAYPFPVYVIQTRVQPPPAAGPFGNPEISAAEAALNPGSTVTVGVAGVASAVPANGARKELFIVNASATGWITVALGPVIPAMWAGIPLAPNGGDILLTAYDGPVSMIAAANGTLVSIAEV